MREPVYGLLFFAHKQHPKVHTRNFGGLETNTWDITLDCTAAALNNVAPDSFVMNCTVRYQPVGEEGGGSPTEHLQQKRVKASMSRYGMLLYPTKVTKELYNKWYICEHLTD